jgi:LysM repeat protein
MAYTVRSGDSLSGIASRLGVSLDALESANPGVTNPDLIYPGQALDVPGREDSFDPAPSASTYTVQWGDTLGGIADVYGTSIDALEAANPEITNPDQIYAGETLSIPGDWLQPQPPPPEPQQSASVYTVQPGDTMGAIADQLGVSLDALEAANPQVTDPDYIYPGQTLNVPGGDAPVPEQPAPAPAPQPDPPPAPSASTYTVQPGDTMGGIAARLGVSLDSLEAANPQVTNPDFIQVGQTLNVPGGAPGAPAPAPVPTGDTGGLNVDKMPEIYRQWIPYVEAAAAQYDLPPALLFAVMSRESNGNNELGDGGHGHGLMQIDDRSWGSWLATHDDGMDPASNIMEGAAILRSNIDYFGGNVAYGLAGYNCGAGNVEKALAAGLGPDGYTTFGNYSSDVLSRVAMFN